ncbi:peptidylprolyl isomerase [Leptothoe spongobia]|uniref:peptidylprolyl isomerase n=1 Tax=Leptothoe spongobia TAU-MAC 1115 TaxID=1967444 RepID=A0A947GHZ1_9CYAN|nr:peptidylprolyl isomerase [Leptothoe spongobia]MBT9315790.1 peptidylprolyl isomerase [Leptothoe spongobia TAU-MAC 1115]
MTHSTIKQQTDTQVTLSQLSTVTDQKLVEYLRYSYRFSELTALAEAADLVVKLCQHYRIDVSDEECQVVGDRFRLEHNLLEVSATIQWLKEQRITLSDWSEGIKLKLLEQKLKEHLFGASVDAHYISHRQEYQKVALSQILVFDYDTALDIKQSLLAGTKSFCTLALEHSKDKQTYANGGFLGIIYLSQLASEVQKAIINQPVGTIIAPIQTTFGYRIFRIEKWFPIEFKDFIREEILETLWQSWRKEHKNSKLSEI